MTGETYFDGIPGIGSLAVEHVFYTYDIPILFVCTDGTGNRYLCSCCRLAERWLISRVHGPDLIRLMRNEIPIRKLFPTGPTMYVHWNGTRYESLPRTPLDGIKPRPDSYLDLPEEKTREYMEKLAKEEKP